MYMQIANHLSKDKKLKKILDSFKFFYEMGISDIISSKNFLSVSSNWLSAAASTSNTANTSPFLKRGTTISDFDKLLQAI